MQSAGEFNVAQGQLLLLLAAGSHSKGWTLRLPLLLLQWHSLEICRSPKDAPLVLHAQVDEDKSGEIEFAEFLRLAERQKQAQARPDNGDTVEAFVALGGKVTTGLAGRFVGNFYNMTAAGLLVHLTGCLFVVRQWCAKQLGSTLETAQVSLAPALSLLMKVVSGPGCAAQQSICCSQAPVAVCAVCISVSSHVNATAAGR